LPRGRVADVRLSIVVVNWNSRDDLRACLESLAAQTYRNIEVLVVDNGSTDGSPEMVGTDFPACRLLAQSGNVGFAEGCNRGIEASTGEWVATLNNDCVTEPGWAQALVDAAEGVPASCGMLQSTMVFLDRPGTINSTGIELTALGGGRDRHRDRTWPNDESRRQSAIFCPTAGAAAYRRAMLDAVRLSTGYFDRTHFMYFEDLDLGWRARLAGWDALFVPASMVRHKWHGSTDRHGTGWLAVLSGINRVRTQIKNASPSFIARTSPVTMVEALEIARHAGFGGLRQLKAAVEESLALRKEVAKIARVSRRAIERAWTTW
jgi:GT2 family glycosyltransferase